MHLILLVVLAADSGTCLDETVGDVQLEADARAVLQNDVKTARECVTRMVKVPADLCLAVFNEGDSGYELERCARMQSDPRQVALLLAEAGDRKGEPTLMLEAQALDPSEGLLRRLTTLPVRRLTCVPGKEGIPLDPATACAFPPEFTEPQVIDTRRWEGLVVARVKQSDSWAHGAWVSETLVIVRPDTAGASMVAAFDVKRICNGRCASLPNFANPAKTRGKTLTWKKLRFDVEWFRTVGSAVPARLTR